MSETLTMGSDITSRLELAAQAPWWHALAEASHGICHDRLTMKNPDLTKWSNGCSQTVVWIGKPTSSRGIKQKQQKDDIREQDQIVHNRRR